MNKDYLLDENKDSQHLDAARHEFLNRYDIARLAKKLMLKSPAILYNRLNPDMEYHHLTVELLEQLTKQTGDNILIAALNKDLGQAVYQIPKVAATSESISKLIFKRQFIAGEFGVLFDKYMENGVLDKQESESLYEHLDSAIEHLVKIKASVKSATVTRPVKAA
jgi:hypothetical protein